MIKYCVVIADIKADYKNRNNFLYRIGQVVPFVDAGYKPHIFDTLEAARRCAAVWNAANSPLWIWKAVQAPKSLCLSVRQGRVQPDDQFQEKYK